MCKSGFEHLEHAWEQLMVHSTVGRSWCLSKYLPGHETPAEVRQESRGDVFLHGKLTTINKGRILKALLELTTVFRCSIPSIVQWPLWAGLCLVTQSGMRLLPTFC